MSNGIEQMQTEFHNKATALFFPVYHAFENAVAGVSRKNQEFRFQQLKKQYAATLEQELQMAAKDILKTYKDEKHLKEADQMLHGFIKDYLHRFIQKINDL